MKQIIIIIVIIIIILGGAMWTQKFLTDTSGMLLGKLEELKENVEKEELDKEMLIQEAETVYNEWEDINEKWSVIVLHNEMDLIETSLIKMKSKIEMGKLKESMEDIETSIFLVEHITEKEKTNFKNIF